MTPEELRTLTLFNTVESSPEINQRQLAQELGPFGIRVNSVAPGFMATSPDYQKQWDSYGEQGQADLVERIPLRRLGRPDDIAHAVMFLASDFADFVTGQTLPVNGTP